ncbi:M48 family metallopeptidase [Novosphingobium album (ex Liu et al. 2023)]|uniref:SprT family zinc-dependent metalloprotease n=1 Tax=Novosphingobium album (ex Liu et al. 2023) TaxID=3031130 RepID=A0ABT5WT16_9SPHN|nr:SprT family zinc-dependent metalloprotease [Novosphingobium album (ex Liu et al. 2023)]MDE8653145.1 SprT family zinc-dependent metalloprotease [Novosphingobium album (ex Liu et al. 2023)]
MLEWLRRDPRAEPAIEIGDRRLPVVVRRLAQARRMTMRLAPDGSEVRISIPRWGRAADALAFAESRREWIARQLAALPRAEPLGTGGVLRFRGEALALRHDPAAPRRPVVEAGTIRIGGPETALAARLRRWLHGEARELLAADLAEYCARAGRPVSALALSNAQRRWGSCAPDGTIRINWRLIMAPDFVRRSVVAHEVAHLVHFDHSPAFHAALARLFEGDIAEANHWLKREGRGLYHPLG